MSRLGQCFGIMAALLATAGGCNSSATLLNPSFVNYVEGGIYPFVPGPSSGFVLVRVINNTENSIEFTVTAERELQVVEGDQLLTRVTSESTCLITFPVGNANQQGVLIDCPVTRVGLGQDLNNPSTDPGLFIGAQTAGEPGFGVPGNVNPLDSRAGNFSCGDTLVFQANQAAGTVGNVSVGSYVLSASTQPTSYQIDTFNNSRSFIEQSRGPEEEVP